MNTKTDPIDSLFASAVEEFSNLAKPLHDWRVEDDNELQPGFETRRGNRLMLVDASNDEWAEVSYPGYEEIATVTLQRGDLFDYLAAH